MMIILHVLISSHLHQYQVDLYYHTNWMKNWKMTRNPSIELWGSEGKKELLFFAFQWTQKVRWWKCFGSLLARLSVIPINCLLLILVHHWGLRLKCLNWNHYKRIEISDYERLEAKWIRKNDLNKTIKWIPN